MVWDDLGRDARQQNDRQRDRYIGVYIGILAVILAICSMGGGNATKDSTLRNIEASDTWSQFQAKNIRRNDVRLQVDMLGLMLESQPGMPAEAKVHIEAKIAAYREYEKKLTSEPDKKEGIEELSVKAKALESARDHAMKRDPYFDYGQALLQIAIVLASIAIVSGGSMLLSGSFILGALGTLATFGGFTLAFPLPF